MSIPTSIPALIVEDENASRRSLKLLLDKFCPEVKVIGEAADVKGASDIIDSEHPQLVFLDINLSRESGFDLLKAYQPLPFKVIFTTAYNQFATQAFRYAALDYLLKPVHYQELIQAVGRFKAQHNNPHVDQQLEALTHNLMSRPSKLALPTREGLQFIELDKVIRCEADSNYTQFHLTSGQKAIASKSLKMYEEMLADAGFFRIHRSHLVNIEYVERYKKGKHPEIAMSDGSILAVAPFRKDLFESYMEQYIRGKM